MYAIELASEFERRAEDLHPKRYKQVYLRVFALQKNPRPPDSEMLEIQTYRVRVGPYRVTYEIDDAQRRVRVFLLEEMKEEDWKCSLIFKKTARCFSTPRRFASFRFANFDLRYATSEFTLPDTHPPPSRRLRVRRVDHPLRRLRRRRR